MPDVVLRVWQTTMWWGLLWTHFQMWTLGYREANELDNQVRQLVSCSQTLSSLGPEHRLTGVLGLPQCLLNDWMMTFTGAGIRISMRGGETHHSLFSPGLVIHAAPRPGRAFSLRFREGGEKIRGPRWAEHPDSHCSGIEHGTEKTSITSPSPVTVQGPQIAEGGGRKPEELSPDPEAETGLGGRHRCLLTPPGYLGAWDGRWQQLVWPEVDAGSPHPASADAWFNPFLTHLPAWAVPTSLPLD